MRKHYWWMIGIVAACAPMVGCGPQYEVASAPNMDRAMALREMMGGGSDDAAGGGGPAGALPIGWVTLKGRVVYDGSPPPQTPLEIKSDVEVCGGANAAKDESLVVGADGGIEGVLVFVDTKLPNEEPWVHPEMGPGGEPVEFDQKHCVFLSHVLAARVGQTVKILNSDPVGHNINLQPKVNAPMNQIVGAGLSLDWVPKAQENRPFPASCSIHPHMKAYVIVRENGYFAVTDKQGNFEIPNLPAGVELELRFWQEKAGWVDGAEIDGNPIKKGKIAVTFEPGEKQWQLSLGDATFN